MPSAPTEVYRRVNEKGTRYWSIALEDNQVTTASGTKPDRLRERTKTCKDEGDAARHYHKTRTKKLREGFVYHRPTHEAEIGEVVSRVALPHAQMHDYFDISLDGRTLFVTSEQRPSNHQAWLYQVELSEARTTLLHHVDAGAGQSFAHRAQCLGERRVLFMVNDHTMCVELDTREVSTLARFRGTSHFNDHCVWPSRDAQASRALVFDANNTLRVLDGDAQTLFEREVGSLTVECRAASLSHDGRFLVGYFASRGIIYNHENAAHDTTQELRVWDVDRDERLQTIPISHPVRRCTIAPDGKTLVALAEYAQGPVFIDLDSGERVDFYDDPYRDDRLQTCYTFAHSPDGTRLALGTHTVRVVATDDRHGEGLALRSAPGAISQPRHLCFSPSGEVLHVGTTGGEVIGYRVR